MAGRLPNSKGSRNREKRVRQIYTFGNGNPRYVTSDSCFLGMQRGYSPRQGPELVPSKSERTQKVLDSERTN